MPEPPVVVYATCTVLFAGTVWITTFYHRYSESINIP